MITAHQAVTWFIEHLTERIFASCYRVNPSLEIRHANALFNTIQKCAQECRSGNYRAALSSARSVVALLSYNNPNIEVNRRLKAFLDILPTDTWTEPNWQDFYTTPEELPEVDHELAALFGVSHPAAFVLPAEKRRSLLRVLKSRIKDGDGIVCPICWEELVNPITKKIEKDVVVLFERMSGSPEWHLHFFNGEALIGWASTSSPTNPVTRSLIDLREFCRLTYEIQDYFSSSSLAQKLMARTRPDPLSRILHLAPSHTSETIFVP